MLACCSVAVLVALQQALIRNNHPRSLAEGQSEMKLINASIKDLSEALHRGEFTSVSLVEVGQYTERLTSALFLADIADRRILHAFNRSTDS